MTTKGDLVRYDSARERVGIGSANQVLQVSGGLPTWQTLATGGNWEAVASTTLSVSGTSINCSFSAIAGTDIARLVIVANLNTYSSGVDVFMRVNGLSNPAHDFDANMTAGGSTTLYNEVSQDEWCIGKSGITGGSYGNDMLLIWNVVPSKFEGSHFPLINISGISMGELGVMTGSGWLGVSNRTSIDEIEIFTSSVNINNGSNLAVYKQNLT